MERKFLKPFATGLALSLIAIYAAYSWPTLMLCLLSLMLWWVAWKWRDNFWLVVSLTILFIMMWFLGKEMMHDTLTHQVVDQVNAVFSGMFQGVKDHFLTK